MKKYYTLIHAYFLHVFTTFARAEYQWGLTRTALVFGTLTAWILSLFYGKFVPGKQGNSRKSLIAFFSGVL